MSASSALGSSDPIEPRAGDVVVQVATPATEDVLGFGWSRAERGRAGRFRWMTHLEADVWLDVGATPRAGDLYVTAAPFYLPWRRQMVGFYMNNRFLGESVCEPGADFHEYAVRLPADCLTPGRNRLTLRVGYREQIGQDDRDLALAVKRILVRFRDE